MGSDRYHATTHFGEKGGAGVKVDSRGEFDLVPVIMLCSDFRTGAIAEQGLSQASPRR